MGSKPSYMIWPDTTNVTNNKWCLEKVTAIQIKFIFMELDIEVQENVTLLE